MTQRSWWLIAGVLCTAFVIGPVAAAFCAPPPKEPPTVVIGLATTKVHSSLSDEVRAQLTRSALEMFNDIAPSQPFDLAIYPVAVNSRGVDVSADLGYVPWTEVRNAAQGRELLENAIAQRLAANIETVTTDGVSWWQRALSARPGGQPPEQVLFIGSPISRGDQLDMYEWKDETASAVAANLGQQAAEAGRCSGTTVSILGAGSTYDPRGEDDFPLVPQVLYDNAEAYWSSAIEACGGTLETFTPFPP